MTVAAEHIGAPGMARLAGELRAPAEAWLTLAVWPWLRFSPRGDGHAVLVLPGLAASDVSTWVLRRFLRAQGWQAHGWQQGRNHGPRRGLLEALGNRIEQLHATTGRRVSLVGWSLGGVFARELAKRHPDLVRQVVTLGSPAGEHRSASNVRWLYERLAGDHAYPPELMKQLRKPLPKTVPFTAIHSRSDGIVHWRATILPDMPLTENIRVPASHNGMGVNPLVLRVLADRLAQPEGDWRPYRHHRP